ncbi:MAG: DUF362 domain-containing protein [Spirochaetia bacterium]|jgi:uncharacterized protein (DUF362 family)/NAD-dependent dihydropyrimidine dehydrogenase PreA subunit
MEKSRVALIRCDGYDESSVFSAVSQGIELLGGLSRFAAPEETILLKPNVLVGDDPGKLVSPHPSVVRAVAKLLRERTSRLTYGDSPSFGRPEPALRKSGLAAAAEESGALPADFTNGRDVSFPASPFTRRFFLAQGVLSCDGIVSIAKLKSHAFMRMTGAVKNQFGCVAGMSKTSFHLKLQDPADFGRMLTALTLCLKPRLYVMDGIVAMQGNGPRGGEPCPMKVLLFSEDPVALDAVMCRLVALDPSALLTNPPGRQWGLGTHLAEEIEIVGDHLQSLVNGDFVVNRAVVRKQLPPAVASIVNAWVAPRPVIDKKRCSRCGTCIEVCPVTPKAVDWREGSRTLPPRHSYERCIRCYCCQEVCPEKAISVRKGLFGA